MGFTTPSAARKATAIGQVYPVSATQAQGCYFLERATCCMLCLRYGDRDRVIGFNLLTLNRVQFTSFDTRRVATSPDKNSFWPLGIGICHVSLITTPLNYLAFRLRATWHIPGCNTCWSPDVAWVSRVRAVSVPRSSG